MRRRNILALLMAAALCLCLLAGCGSAETTDSTGTSIAEATTIADLKGMKIAAQAGTFHADALNQIENVQGSTYPEFADLLTALKSGAIDGYIAEEPTAFSVCGSDDTLTFLPLKNNETGFTATASDVGIADRSEEGLGAARADQRRSRGDYTPSSSSAAHGADRDAGSSGGDSDRVCRERRSARKPDGHAPRSAWSARTSRITGPTSPAHTFGAVPISRRGQGAVLYANGYDVQIAQYVAAQ